MWGRAGPEGRPETPPLCCTAPPHGTPALIEQTKKRRRSLGLGSVYTLYTRVCTHTYVLMCAHVYTLCAHVHTCMHVYTHYALVCTHTCVHVYTLVGAHTHTCQCTYSYKHVPLRVHTHACKHTCTCSHVHTYKHTHTIHTHVCTNVPFILTLLEVVKLVSTSWV